MSSEDFMGLLNQVTDDQKRRATHRSSCTKRPCETCEIFICPRCNGDMFGRNGECFHVGDIYRTGVCERCAAREIRAYKLRHAFGSIPKHFAWATFTNPELEARAGGRRMVELGRQSAGSQRVILTGPSGTGKTSLAVAMLQMHLELGMGERASGVVIKRAAAARFASAIALSEARSAHPLGRGEAPFIRAARTASVLVLDDLGMEKDPTAAQELIYLRHNEELPTWITTYLTPEQIGARYGGGIERRLTEKARILKFTGQEAASQRRIAS